MIGFDRSRQLEFLHAVERFERTFDKLQKLNMDFNYDNYVSIFEKVQLKRKVRLYFYALIISLFFHIVEIISFLCYVR